MAPSHKREILFLYLGYFVALAVGLIPLLSWYAIGATALLLFYAIIRYVSVSGTDRVFRSHALNYIIALGVSFVLYFIIMIQASANGLSFGNPFVSAFTSAIANLSSANSLGYVILMIALEGLIALIWPPILIGRGLYLINRNTPIIGDGAQQPLTVAMPETSSVQTNRWLASAVMPDGHILKFEIDGQRPIRIIGRDPETADIVLNDDSVSRPHARIEIRGPSIWISDINSLNGTVVGDRAKLKPFTPVQLQPSDRIKLGLVMLTISSA